MEYEEANEKIIAIEITRKKEKLRFRNRLKSMKRKERTRKSNEWKVFEWRMMEDRKTWSGQNNGNGGRAAV